MAKTTRFIFDTYYHINHSPQDIMCWTWCNSNPIDGSAPNLVIPAVDKDGNPVLKCAFNTQMSRLRKIILKFIINKLIDMRAVELLVKGV